jgi:lysine 2,3-aminomutase
MAPASSGSKMLKQDVEFGSIASHILSGIAKTDGIRIRRNTSKNLAIKLFVPKFKINMLTLRSEWEKLRRSYLKGKKNKWGDWRWHLKNRITTIENLCKVVKLKKNEIKEISDFLNKGRKMSIPPYYALLIDKNNPLEDPIGKTMIPRAFMSVERLASPVFAHEQDIPVMDGKDVVVVRDRYLYEILFRCTWFCPNLCQFCYTGEETLEKGAMSVVTKEDIDLAIEYVRRVNSGNLKGIKLRGRPRENIKIRDILLSGGEFLALPDETVEYVLKKLRGIGFDGVIRIGVKILATIPMRITEKFAKMLARYWPVQIDASIVHPKEFTPEFDRAVEILQRNRIMINTGTVLLNGINNNENTINDLLWGFHQRGLNPEYFYRVIGRYGNWAKTKRSDDMKLFEPFWNHKKVPGPVTPKLVDPTHLGKVITCSSTFPCKYNPKNKTYIFTIDGEKTVVEDPKS